MADLWEWERTRTAAVWCRHSSDDDVDESCMEYAGGIDVEGVDDEALGEEAAALWVEGRAPAVSLLQDQLRQAERARSSHVSANPGATPPTVEDERGSSIETVRISRVARVSSAVAGICALHAASSAHRRHSLAELPAPKHRLTPAAKAAPAGCAVTACSIRAAVRRNTIDACSRALASPPPPHVSALDQKRPATTAQTVQSPSGVFQVLWEEPGAPSTRSSFLTLLDPAAAPPDLVFFPDDDDNDRHDEDDDKAPARPRAPSPMENATTKLAAWTWARQQHPWLPLLSLDPPLSHQDHSPGPQSPLPPPNIQHPSHAHARSPSSSTDSLPLELALAPRPRSAPRAPPSPPPPPPPPRPSLLVPPLFNTHRDSLELLRRRDSADARPTTRLTHARDSVVLAKLRGAHVWAAHVGGDDDEAVLRRRVSALADGRLEETGGSGVLFVREG